VTTTIARSDVTLTTDTGSPTTATPVGPKADSPRRHALGIAIGTAAVLVIGVTHLSHGSSSTGLTDLVGLVTGDAPPGTADVLIGSRLPRLLAGLLAGIGASIAGVLLQSVSRNQLAAPDTLGINAGAYLAMVAAAVFGLPFGWLGGGTAAFVGGLTAAVVVYLLAGGTAATPGRLLLAGAALTMTLMAGATALMILDEQRTQGLFFWGAGTLVQTGFVRVGPQSVVIMVAAAGALLLARNLDLLGLGDDAARAVGANVDRTRMAAIGVAVLLASAAVTVAGPIAFVGLVAPLLARMLGLRVHRWLIPAAALLGAAMLLGADLLARQFLRGPLGGEVPAGLITAAIGAPFFLALARRVGTGLRDRSVDLTSRPGAQRTPYPLVLGTAVVVLAVVIALGLRFGDLPVTWSDLIGAVTGSGDAGTTMVIGHRAPRLIVGAAAGACLALAGAALQAVARNPLAEPYLLGVTGGCGLGAVSALAFFPGVAIALPTMALAGGLLAAAVVLGLARGSDGMIDPGRIILIGIGVAAMTTSVVHMFAIGSSAKLASALTWLSGTTYARTWDTMWLFILPLAAIPVLVATHRSMDLLSLGDDLPRSLGLRLQRLRAGLLASAVVIAAGAAAAVGTIGFVGLVAPHLARRIAGPRHRHMLAVSAVLGAILVVAADTAGRSLLAPREIPAGIITALIGAPYLIWLLRRTTRSGLSSTLRSAP
jgi:ferric hydroxamate transport system permease protein